MMTDQFGLTDDMYLSDGQRGLAADLSRAFDSSREIQERTMARYGIPALANYERNWAIERARTMADQTNRARLGLNQNIQGRRNSRAQSLQGRSSIGGLMNFLPILLGRDGWQNFQNQGAISYVRDAFGRVVGTQSQPIYPNSPIDQNAIDQGFDVGVLQASNTSSLIDQNYIDQGFDIGATQPSASPIDQNYIDAGFELPEFF